MIFKLLGGGRQFLVSAGTDEQQALVICEHVMSVSENPETVAVSLLAKGAVFDLINRTQEFVLAVPSKDAAERAVKCSRAQKGSRFVDMFSECSLSPGRAQKISAPTIEEAEFNLECRVTSIMSCGDRSIVVGEVVHLGIREEKDDRPKEEKRDEKPSEEKKEEKSKDEKRDEPKTEKKDEKARDEPKDTKKEEKKEEKPRDERKAENAKDEKKDYAPKSG